MRHSFEVVYIASELFRPVRANAVCARESVAGPRFTACNVLASDAIDTCNSKNP